MNLKPCPFCGSKVKHLTKFDVVYCSNVECGLNYENGGGYTREYWNTRPIEDKLSEQVNLYPELVEALKKISLLDDNHGWHDQDWVRIAREVLKKAGEI